MKTSVALALVRGVGSQAQVLLVHPGGPFFAKKNEGAWGLPKGLLEAGEEPLQAARREFQEESTGRCGSTWRRHARWPAPLRCRCWSARWAMWF
jgi:predicted NUDIX family NTP pyrophosphohydrolase